MAQHKYDLDTVLTNPAVIPKHQPWYKERLDLKFLKRGRKAATLNGKKWTLLAGNMDDFRSGMPACTKSKAMASKGTVDLVPLISSSHSLPVLSGRGRSSGRAPLLRGLKAAPSTLYTKVGPRRQMQRAYLQQLEDRLLHHPLDLHPHLQQAVPESTDGVCEDDGTVKEEVKAKGKSETTDESSTSKQAAIYRWPLKQSEEEKREEQRLLASQVISPAQESTVNACTHNLVQWGRELGGDEQFTIDETTIKKLFDSGYESNATYPCVPPELCRDSCLSSTATVTPHSPSERDREPTVSHLLGRRRKSLSTPSHFTDIYESGKPRCVKSRYGAWYLPTSLWRLRWEDEPLLPERNISSSELALAVQTEALNREVAQLYGAQAFKEYLTSRAPGTRVPTFLLEHSLPQNTAEK